MSKALSGTCSGEAPTGRLCAVDRAITLEVDYNAAPLHFGGPSGSLLRGDHRCGPFTFLSSAWHGRDVVEEVAEKIAKNTSRN